ncbi:hypothetical protein ABPG74_006764 [Tetrahymena malaccensis]
MRTLFKFIAVAALVSTLFVVSFSDKINLRSTQTDLPDCVYIQNDYGHYYVRNICTQSMKFKILLKNIKNGKTRSVDTQCLYNSVASFDISQDYYQIVEIAQNTC